MFNLREPLLLIISSWCFSFVGASAGRTTGTSLTKIYNFDDLNTSGGVGSIHSYHLLTFRGFSVIDPYNLKVPSIQPFDRNCATSRPNMLVGSRYGDEEDPSSIRVNVTAAQMDGFQPFFHLQSFSIKPLSMSVSLRPWIATLEVKGGCVDTNDIGANPQLRIQWPAGYVQPLYVDMQGSRFSKDDWTNLQWLDFSVDFGPGEMDWEFCLDDLKVGLTGQEEILLQQ